MTATLLGFFVGILMFGVMGLLPILMQSLLGYPASYAGLVSMPRGTGTFLSMLMVGQLMMFVNVRILLATGLCLLGGSLWVMTSYNLSMDSRLLEITGLMSGIGGGLVFVPLSTIAFSTISPNLRAEAAGFYTLIRNIGSSVGISIMQAYMVSNMAAARSAMLENVRPDNPIFQSYYPSLFNDHAALSRFSAEVSRQAMMMSYVQTFTVLFLLAVCCLPLILILRAPRHISRSRDLHAVVD